MSSVEELEELDSALPAYQRRSMILTALPDLSLLIHQLEPCIQCQKRRRQFFRRPGIFR